MDFELPLLCPAHSVPLQCAQTPCHLPSPSSRPHWGAPSRGTASGGLSGLAWPSSPHAALWLGLTLQPRPGQVLAASSSLLSRPAALPLASRLHSAARPFAEPPASSATPHGPTGSAGPPPGDPTHSSPLHCEHLGEGDLAFAATARGSMPGLADGTAGSADRGPRRKARNHRCA